MITKTDFLTYLDAPRHLWALKNNLIDRDTLDVYLGHLIRQGYDVERLAVEYSKKYLMKEYGCGNDDILIQPKAIDGEFEARTDILIKDSTTGRWDMYEVKASTKVDRDNRYDATFQYLVFSKSYDIDNVYILHLNKEYVRDGELYLPELFVRENLNSSIEELKDEVLDLREDAYLVSQLDDISKTISCIKPKGCPCIDKCHPKLPEYSIYDINNLTASKRKIFDLRDMDIESVYDVPKNFDLSFKQRLQVDIAQSNEIFIDKEGIKERLDALKYPLYFIDYETYSSAIPLFDGYRPFDHITFQYSLHVLNENNEMEHYEFLHTKKTDPIPHLLDSLKKVIGDSGSIIVWNESFERTKNERMGEIYPEYGEFTRGMNDRMFDLMRIFQDQLYSDPKIKGSYSIKNVLPVLVKDLSYKGMDIGEGATAMVSWYGMVFDDKDDVRDSLLEYCKLDTLAMVRILEELTRIV